MKNYVVSYIKGHLVDQKTGKRIFLKRGGEFFIQGDDDQFEEKDELHKTEDPLPENEKLSWLLEAHPGFIFEKLADAGKEFVFRVGLATTTSEDKFREFFFKARILEELYIKSKTGKKWSLCDCLCQAYDSLDNRIQMIEPVNGKSLNNLFANVVTFYFPLQRSTACNAFKTFLFADTYNPMLNVLNIQRLVSLENIRVDIINNFKKRKGIFSKMYE